MCLLKIFEDRLFFDELRCIVYVGQAVAGCTIATCQCVGFLKALEMSL